MLKKTKKRGSGEEETQLTNSCH